MAQDQNNKPSPTLVEVFTNFFRAATRPAVTIIFAAVIAQVVVQGIDAPQWFLGLATACILWWFGDRTVQHIQHSKLECWNIKEKKEQE
jgi:threonine/homoserine/homoserine lactone efflux protein